MNLNKCSLKVIAKTIGGLFVAAMIIVIANWPRSKYWMEDLDKSPGEGEFEYVWRLIEQRTERLCVEENGWTHEAYQKCMAAEDWDKYRLKVDLFEKPDGKGVVALAVGDPGYDTLRQRFTRKPARSAMSPRSQRGSLPTTPSPTGPSPIDSNRRREICGASSQAECEEILKAYIERGPQAAEELRVRYWEAYRASNPPAVEPDSELPPIYDSVLEKMKQFPVESEDVLMVRAATLCRSDEDLKKPDCVTALNAYRMRAAERIMAERAAYGSVPPPPVRRDSYGPGVRQSQVPRDRVYYLNDGRRVQESPGGMRMTEPARR